MRISTESALACKLLVLDDQLPHSSLKTWFLSTSARCNKSELTMKYPDCLPTLVSTEHFGLRRQFGLSEELADNSLGMQDVRFILICQKPGMVQS